jgi:CheY-like chemotaxis protein
MILILLVDDDPDILEILQLDLEDDPALTVETAGTSAAALEKVRKKRYDIIVTDWRMPVMNGTQLIRALRADGCRSHIILYSGHNISADIRTALDSGADHIVSRGGDPDSEFAELKREIHRAISSTTHP